MPAPKVVIATVDRTKFAQNVEITYTLGSRGVARFSIVDPKLATANAYRPATDDAVIISNETGAIDLFSGDILSVHDSPIVIPNKGTVTAVDAVDRSRMADARIVQSETWAAGTSLKTIVTDLVTYLSPWSITLDAGMATGPALEEFVVSNARVTDVLNRLAGITGWFWRITPALVLEFFSPGSKTSPFSLTTANAKILGEVAWSKSMKQKVNRVILEYGTERQIQKIDVFTATSGQTNFPLTYPAVGVNLRGYVGVDSNPFVPLGVAPWSYNAAQNRVEHATGASVGTVLTVTYDAQFPVTVVRENGSASADPWEEKYEAPEIFDKDAAIERADALLRRYEVIPRTITVQTREGFVLPGSTITLTIAERAVSGTWLITGTRIRSGADQRFTYDYTCVEGTEAADSWVDQFKSMLHSAPRGGNITGSLLPQATGMFSTEVIAYSGSASHPHESRLSTWTNASLQGPAVTLGRPDSVWGWSIIGDHLAASPNVRRLRFAPIGDANSTTRFAMQLTQADSPTSGEYYLTHGPGGNTKLHLGAPSSILGSGFQITKGWFTDFDVTNGITERSRTTKLGEAISVTYSAGNFTAVGGGSWGVDSADQVTFAYSLVGKLLTVFFTIANTDVTGTANELNIAIPGGFTSAKRIDQACWLVDAGTREPGQIIVNASGTQIRLFRSAAGAFTVTSADDTAAVGQVVIEIQ